MAQSSFSAKCPPTKPANVTPRSREYLTAEEVELLLRAARLWSAIIESSRRKRVSSQTARRVCRGKAPLDNDAPSSDNSQE